MGQGPRQSNGACSILCQFSITPSTTHNQIGPLWCWFPSGWVCVSSRYLWVSPMTSSVRLGVSPAAASTPTGVFNQRFEALFPRAGALGHALCFAPLLDCPLDQPSPCRPATALPTWLHSLPPHWVRQPLSCPPRSSSHDLAASPLCPAARVHPSYRSGWMFPL